MSLYGRDCSGVASVQHVIPVGPLPPKHESLDSTETARLTFAARRQRRPSTMCIWLYTRTRVTGRKQPREASGQEHAVEKASTTKGWTFTMFEEIWNSGFPQEMQHFADCVMYDRPPLLTGEDGRAVLEVVYAAYASAARGAAVELPFRPLVARPVDLWRTSS